MSSNLSSTDALTGALQAQVQGDWAQASALYETVLAGVSDPAADTLTNYGQVLRRLGRHGEALEAYRRATAKPEASAQSWFNLGNALFDDSQWERALTTFERALELDGTLEPAAMQRARCLVKLDRLMEARESVSNSPLRIMSACDT